MSSLAQRKFQSLKKQNFASNKCRCGNNVIEKDHGNWIGWFCPKCKSGGSKNKKRY
jgi:Zn finger protein HypA/HybF involved in hydrogenase expression